VGLVAGKCYSRLVLITHGLHRLEQGPQTRGPSIHFIGTHTVLIQLQSVVWLSVEEYITQRNVNVFCHVPKNARKFCHPLCRDPIDDKCWVTHGKAQHISNLPLCG